MQSINLSDKIAYELWNLYEEKRNLGLKKDANKILNKLVEFVMLKNESEKEEFVRNICFEKFENGTKIDLQYPILSKLIFPVLFNYIDKPKMPELRWLYEINFYYDNSFERLSKKLNTDNPYEQLLILAHKTDENDIRTLEILTEFYFYGLWYGSHHFPDFELITEIEVNNILEKLDKIQKKYNIFTNKDKNDYNYYKELYFDWYSFKKESQEITFKEWCEEKNRKYHWVKSYYYK